MPIIDAMRNELEHEAVGVRKVLERVPDDKFDWKPHEKSMTFGQLASHVAEALSWGAFTLNEEGFDVPAEYKPWHAANSAELMERFEANLKAALDAMQDYPDQDLMKDWTLKGDGQVFFSMPRIAVMRSFVLNHVIHHRAQLTVYLRLNDIPVPAIYGPSADEQE